MGPVEHKPSYNPDLSSSLSEIKRNKNKGRCLHFDAGTRCNEYINAHSIQNKGQLVKIVDKGHVYTLSNSFTDIRKYKGKLCYKKFGINKVSTFLGFCKNHDNELFNE